jgi:iron-sulfur cluster insertion protein
MIEVTNSAVSEITKIMNEDYDIKTNYLRIYVEGGGCSGFQYGFDITEEQNEDDFLVEKEEVKILIDSMSMSYLSGAKVDYKEDLIGSQFVINNPNAETTCGCGSSFSA